jgi:hypothetical protein
VKAFTPRLLFVWLEQIIGRRIATKRNSKDATGVTKVTG